MAVVIASDESTYYAPGLRRSHSQPKFSSKQTSFRQSASASRISDVYHQQRQQQQQQIPPHSQPPAVSNPSDPSTTLSPHNTTIAAADMTVSPAKQLVPSLRLPPHSDRPGYGSSPIGTDDGIDTDADVAIDYPHYDGVSYYNPTRYTEPPSSSLRGVAGDAYVPSSNDNTTLSSTDPSRTDSADFDVFDHVAEDDTAIRARPSRHVDYLSHNWKEEEIWESWKYIVSRRGDYTNSARLENASWRTWMKSKNKLKTVSPETLNWLKDCDVTWLYGPLQTGNDSLAPGQTTDSVELTKSNSFLASNKKPILKKRSMSEIMLQRSLSASSLVKQAAAAVQAQQKDSGARRMPRPRLERATTDYVTFALSSRRYSPGPPSMLHSSLTSGVVSPSVERKHIHFNEQVEQCIAVEAKGDDGDEEDVPAVQYNNDSDSDDGAIMMKHTLSKHRIGPKRRHSFMNYTRSKTHTGGKTIAMLPSTTLKYREEIVDPEDVDFVGSAMKHTYRSPTLSPSSSQETLRPSKTLGKMFFGGDDDEGEDETENVDRDEDEFRRTGKTTFRPKMNRDENEDEGDDDDDDDDSDDDGIGMAMASSRKRTSGLLSSASTSRLGNSIDAALQPQSLFAGSSGGGGGGGGLKRTTSTNSLSAEPAGMRRTASGMFMPYDEGEPAGGGNAGLVGRVIDTINTARDIVHVIWNVGWRK
ncbi:protein phosphatase type 1 complex subunit hex2 [Niveomyces insectorum RCEF 264]|uniref:Protein phosphatase type 1 complex subunit hex2 n=1 Tax=Niveomyces insectorum RCEF 264 TaxID=1081102 RepID=A0A167X2C5_9HYPO|nr:protein phosphatase type 1 complex subunit hex2 [Niveomyces insectorum RCEF 264]